MKRRIKDIEECGISITNAFDSFITNKKSEGRRDATIRSYKGSIKDFMKFCEDKGYTDVSEINKDLVEKYKLHLLDKDIYAETRNTYLRTLLPKYNKSGGFSSALVYLISVLWDYICF